MSDSSAAPSPLFETQAQGYSKEQVDAYVRAVHDPGHAPAVTAALLERAQNLAGQTVQAADKAGQEALAAAQQRATGIVAQAEQRAQTMIADAQGTVNALTAEAMRLEKVRADAEQAAHDLAERVLKAAAPGGQ